MAMAQARASLTPAITYRDPRAAMNWLQKALGFELAMLLETPDGQVAHCEMRLGDGTIMVGSEWSEEHRSPASLAGKNTQHMHVHIESDVDAHCEQARAAGADIFMAPETQFYGDRTYRLHDPEGHVWTVSQTVSAVTREEAEAASGLKITGWV
jgi:uncharacterized glyoxalase superfamily protein PhnB